MRDIHAKVKSIAVSTTLASLVACSPYVYNQEITNFSNGVNSIESSYQTGQQAIATLVLQDQQSDYVNNKAKLTLANGCLDSNALPPTLPECAIVPFSSSKVPLADQTQSDIASYAQLTRAGQTFDALKAYTAALTAVSNATDDATLDQASQSLQTAIGNFATEASKVAPKDASLNTAATIVKIPVNSIIITALDAKRYAALKATVPTVDPFIAASSKTLTDALLSIRQVQLAHMVDDMTDAAEPFESGDAGKLTQSGYQNQLAALQSKVAAFNQARLSNPSATISSMIEAHKQLATALQNNTGQSQAIATAVLNFATAAGQLKTAVDSSSSSTTATKTSK